MSFLLAKYTVGTVFGNGQNGIEHAGKGQKLIFDGNIPAQIFFTIEVGPFFLEAGSVRVMVSNSNKANRSG